MDGQKLMRMRKENYWKIQYQGTAESFACCAIVPSWSLTFACLTTGEISVHTTQPNWIRVMLLSREISQSMTFFL